MTTDPDPTAPLRGVLDEIDRLAAERDVSLGRLVTAFGTASFFPALMVPAILVISPLSGVPLFSSLCGLTIALISAQILMRRRHLWLPGVLMRRRVPGERLRAAVLRARKVGDWLDRRAHRRLTLMQRPPLSVIPQLGCLGAGAMMPFLELVPFSSSILGTAVLLFAIGFLAQDGLFAVAGLAVMGVAGAIPAFMLSQIAG